MQIDYMKINTPISAGELRQNIYFKNQILKIKDED